MSVDFDAFLAWAEDRFKGDVVVKGNEIKINSIFTEDHKHHLWCSVTGGKYKRENGCYRCLKTDTYGTLVGLVMKVDCCDYEEAKAILEGQTSFRLLEERLDAFFANKQECKITENKINLPDSSFLISEMPSQSLQKMEAESYLNNRKIPNDGLYYCCDGLYSGRIVIPYYDESGKLIYFNSRHVGKAKLRYMGPPKSVGVGKGNVLYFKHWPKDNSTLHLCEGEFDAISLCLCGLHGVACGGKYLSNIQLDIIRRHHYHVCLALDRDPTTVESEGAGFKATLEIGEKLLAHFIPTTFVRPAKNYKDWNQMLINLNPQIIKEYIKLSEQVIDELVLQQLRCY